MPKNDTKTDTKKVALVTGASSGIGRSTALLLASKGYRVFGTSRNPDLSDKDIDMMHLDVDFDESASSCITAIMDLEGRLDVLVNNAGYLLTGALEELSTNELKSQFETNFFGCARMVREVLPIMRAQKSGSIINVSSLADTIPMPFQGAYATSKAALFAYSEVLRQEVKGFGVKVSVVEPGYIKTAVIEKGKTPAEPMDEYVAKRQRVSSMISGDIAKGEDPDIVAKAILRIIRSRNPRFRYPVGKHGIYLLAKRFAPESTFESNFRKHWGLDE
ncbi:MAG: SDR family NAD(P)-dependent oxidoreductase [Candidatus Micrarchaeaceae archaeon]